MEGWGTKNYINGLGHMTKIAVMPIYMYTTSSKKNFKNQKSDYHETCHGVLRSEILQSKRYAKTRNCSINGDPGLTLTYLPQGHIWSLMPFKGEIYLYHSSN